MKRGYALTGQGATAVAAAVVLVATGAVLDWPELVQLGVACAAAPLVALAFVAGRPRVAVTRQLVPPRLTAGEPAVAILTVENVGRRSTPALLVTDRVGGRPVTVAAPSMGPGELRRAHHALATGARGRLAIGPVTTVRTDPLALLRWAQPAGGADVLWVHPRTHPLSPLPAGVVADFEGQLSESAPRGTITFSSLREYEPGDDLRQVHWASTARTGTLMVREQVDTSLPRATVALDTRPTLWTPEAFEAAVEVAASIVRCSEHGGYPVALRITGGGERPPEETGALSLLDRLAAVGTGPPGRPDDLFLDLRRAPAGGALVAITGRLDSADLPRLGGLRRRFNPVVVVRVAEELTARVSRRRGLVVVDAPTSASFAASWASVVVGRW